MRTLIAPPHPGVESQLRGLDRKRAEIARRYIRRLTLEPYLGYPLRRGRLAGERCRAVRFDRGDRPRRPVRPTAARDPHRQPGPQPGACAGGSSTGCARHPTAGCE